MQINLKAFIEKNLCFRLHFQQGLVNVKAISDEDLDLSITGKSCLLLNPCFKDKQAILDDFQIEIKVPMEKKMLKFVGNYEISVLIRKAAFDVNKKFIKNVTKWFVSLYTLQKIVSVAKKVILKTHYQEEIIRSQEHNVGQGVTIANHRDTMVPKRLKVQI